MDKYQLFALKQTRYVLYEDEELKKPITGDHWLELSQGKLVVKQLENYNITKYFLRIDGATISSAEFDGKSYGLTNVNNSSHPSVVIPLDFNNKVEKLIIKYSVVDDIEVCVEYLDANRDIYDAKVKQAHADELCKKARIELTTGNDLVNITFKPCCSEYKRTEIALYNGSNMLMGKFKVDEEMFFKSITGLAYGSYYVVVSQFDAKDNSLFTSQRIEFKLSAPNYSGRNTVTFGR